ncbi:hypothetical protein SK128_019594 [Halocaridina rubra]|uniref:Uncharacterized protein n=1 Tax=Halocaridina rubra TaxID=373956 RepID=A0AAN8XHU2_HALRR
MPEEKFSNECSSRIDGCSTLGFLSHGPSAEEIFLEIEKEKSGLKWKRMRRKKREEVEQWPETEKDGGGKREEMEEWLEMEKDEEEKEGRDGSLA